MKKYLFLVLTLIFALTLCAGLAACSPNDDDGDQTTYTVTFKVGDTVYQTVEIPTSGSVVFPDDPAKTGYTFIGWYDGDTKITEISSSVKANKTLTAKFEAITYTATFKADGQTVAAKEFTVESESIAAPEIPNKAGYTAVWENYTVVADNITVNAVYTPITYTATFKADGSVVAVKEFTVENMEFTAPNVPEKTGHFGMWEDYTLGLENIVINAVYTEGDYSVTFMAGQVIVGQVGYK
jgi:uncharacterized repeat protein (TIGR02543 family)